MSIVRSLLTKLSFQVDKSGLQSFEKSIVGFKTKLLLTSAAIGASFSKTIDYFTNFSKTLQDTDTLASRLKLATGEFIALRKAAEDFNLDPNRFEGYFERLGKLLREGKSGFGEIFEIARKSRYELNLKPFADSGDVKGAFVAILDYVKSLKNLEDQAEAVRSIFQESNPNGLLRLVAKGSDEFLKAAENNRAYGDSLAAIVPKTDEYLKSANAFQRQLESLQVTFVEHALPALTYGLEKIEEGIKGFSLIKQQNEQGGLGASLDFAGKAIADHVYDFLGLESLSSIQRKSAEDDYEFNKRLNQFYDPMGPKQPVTIETNIEVNVPPGTSSEMAVDVAAVLKQTIESIWDEKTREIVGNNPQVE